MRYRVFVGGLVLLAGCLFCTLNVTRARATVRALPRSEAARIFGGAADQCKTTFYCTTLCILVGGDCWGCVGDTYPNCRPNPGTKCTASDDPTKGPLTCGFLFKGPPVDGNCTAAECKFGTAMVCGYKPANVTGDPCP